MLLKNMLKVILLFSFSIVMVSSLYSQDEVDNSLDGQYELLMKKSTTYQDYKVIKVVGINQLWENINDSIASINTNYYAAQAKIANLKNELSAVKDSLDLTSKALEESNFGRDRISFLGIPLLKITYNSIVWGIILILAALSTMLFLRFVKSHAVTKSTQKEYKKLEEEFEDFKKNTRENEINLKRDLQTAVNTIEDLKR